ncbi:rod shape-determining protein RodA [Flavobacterium sp.]|jgi:rod shape determining protein RodA|uniref:rod shape-determining protein RodA n=1 Tax=Flavobacterium sp. TaxID=239 RepID=UPI0037BF0121
MKNQSVSSNIDWMIVSIYIVMVILGWLNIYSSSLPEVETSIFDLSQEYGKQLLIIALTIPLIIIVLSIDSKFYEKFSFVIYIIGVLAIAGLFVFGKEVKGQTNWYSFGSFGLQPSEFAKAATSLALAKYLSDVQVNLKNLNHQIIALGLIFLPILFIVPHDPGSALIYTILIFVLHREGLPSSYLWIGLFTIIIFVLSLVMNSIYIVILTFLILVFIYYRSRIADRNLVISIVTLAMVTTFSYSTSYVFDNVLKQHHRDRFNILLGKKVDDKGVGYNVNQSKIAIGSGGLFGKGYLEGTQTKGGFVPEQHTDYIFTTVGEEWGFFGSLLVIGLYLALFFRIIYLSERQKTKFSRIYGYSVASILFVHFFVNIAMVLGIFPTIGVPLPFFSYGGSGLWGFTILLFIFLKMDANKVNEW